MRLTLVHPAIGHRLGESYIRSWQMEPLPIATLAGLTPADVSLRFYDDRMERIPYDEPTDAVAIPVETYTAARAYQIASEYRRRDVPVIMGGFHPTLVPDEVSRYCEAMVLGEAEGVWAEVIDDLRHGTLKRIYRGKRTDLSRVVVDRSLFQGKRYLPIGLVETGRGCRFPCEFCAIQSFFERSYRRRDIGAVVKELESLQGQKKLFFFVDDNFAGDIQAGKELLPALEPLKLRWITQMSINAAHDEDFVRRLARSGCRGVLIGFESLNPDNLRRMNKRFNTMKTGYAGALANLRRHGIAVYGTFVFGYEHDNRDSFDEAVDFAMAQDMYIAAFNHLTPFPGTPLYARLQQEGRLRYDAWWRDPRYRYNEVPFTPGPLSPQEITDGCVAARQRFYNWPSILKRSLRNCSDFFMLRNYLPINALHRGDISRRNGYPLGDEAWSGPLLEVA
ncbi:B12-binding domain-containing radical SAM protein [Malikia spinosa]|uniref:B12-binding domain-containing radical SAM protein n=1 Tax=Malikia spinosa TaxID=86180 RepID=A0A2S9KJ81_9BURK|nr:radical SAM protein [Malikia spinosa]PRD70499.1 B12-binding domain-containing radical SAM protein [Malikia spinosa]